MSTNIGGGGKDPEEQLQDRVDLTHADEKAAQKFAPREDNYDATSEHAKGSSGEKVRWRLIAVCTRSFLV